jgi:TonB family protein
MQLDLEDYKPDTPRLATANSWRGGVLSLVVHGAIVLFILFAPSMLFNAVQQAQVIPVDQDQVRFVQMVPMRDRVAPPKPLAESSDKNRRATSPEKVPTPENTAPVSRGSTPDKVVGAPNETAKGPNRPDPPAPDPAPTPPPQVAAKMMSDTPLIQPPQQQAAGGALGASLRNLQRYLQDQNFNNQKGGLTQQDPDIQFDSKGVEFGPWLARFIAQVKSNWFVPDAAMVMSGHVALAFNVHRDGTITDLRIVTPSTVTAFTNAAMGAIRLSNPTMTLPAEYPADQAAFIVTFHYNEGIR